MGQGAPWLYEDGSHYLKRHYEQQLWLTEVGVVLHLFFFREGWVRTPTGDTASDRLSRSSCPSSLPCGLSVLHVAVVVSVVVPRLSWDGAAACRMAPAWLRAGVVCPRLANAQSQGQDLFRGFVGGDFLPW